MKPKGVGKPGKMAKAALGKAYPLAKGQVMHEEANPKKYRKNCCK